MTEPTIEKRLEELKSQAKALSDKRTELMKEIDNNTMALMRASGAIEELAKLVDNNTEGVKK